MSLLTELSRSVINADYFAPALEAAAATGRRRPQSYNQLFAATALPLSLGVTPPVLAVSSTGRFIVCAFQQAPALVAFQTYAFQSGAWTLANTTTTPLTGNTSILVYLSENNDLLAIADAVAGEVAVYASATTSGSAWTQVGPLLTAPSLQLAGVVQINNCTGSGLQPTLSVLTANGTALAFYTVSVAASTLTLAGTLTLPAAFNFQNFVVSNDFSTLAVANNYVNANVGQVIVLSRAQGAPVSAWQVQQTLDPVGVSSSNVYAGVGLSMSGDASVLAVGCPGDGFNAPASVGTTGAVLIYNQQTGGGYDPGQKIIPLDYAPASTQAVNFGGALELSFDGNTLAATGWYDNGTLGATWVFDRAASGGVWTQNGNKLNLANASPAILINEGLYVALARDTASVVASSVTQTALPNTNLVNAIVIYQSPASVR